MNFWRHCTTAEKGLPERHSEWGGRIGYVECSTANFFTLGGGYVLPPGDQNNPPYDQFSPLAEDVHWNGNGQIDDLNPFPFSIYRSANLVGRLVTASAVEGCTGSGIWLCPPREPCSSAFRSLNQAKVQCKA
jgi:hypothetical protein